MESFEIAIIGSGPAGIAAALQLENPSHCIIDVGDGPSVAPMAAGSLAEALREGHASDLLGAHWEYLANIRSPRNRHPKLRSAGVRFVTQGQAYQVFGEGGQLLVEGQGSFAAGGLANIWGGQLFRYTDSDLNEAGGWPIGAHDLGQYYEALEARIGISGELDDMADYLGPVTGLYPAIARVPAAQFLLNRYARSRGRRALRGLLLGKSRLAVLSQPHRGRPAADLGERDFFTPGGAGVYNPRETLQELRQRGRIRYLGGHQLLAFRETGEWVELTLQAGAGTEPRAVRARHLLLACGTIQTSRLVLMNRGVAGQSLPFIDHPPTLLPLFVPAMFGCALPQRSYPIQLVGTLEGGTPRDMISFYYPGGMLWSDLLLDIPLPMDAARKVLAALLGGMLVAQIWQTSRPSPRNRLTLGDNGVVRIDYPQYGTYPKLGDLLSALRHLGGYSLPFLASASPPGWGFHHAGTLPMRLNPAPFETHVDGRLWDSQRVRVIDGCVLPSLPAKNHSLTLMANAARIAQLTASCGS